MLAPQSEVGGWAQGQNFVLNLDYLFFKLSEFVLSSFTRYPKIKFGGWGNVNPPIEFQGPEWCQKSVLNLCYLCLKVLEFVLLFLVLYIKQKFGGGGVEIKKKARLRWKYKFKNS